MLFEEVNSFKYFKAILSKDGSCTLSAYSRYQTISASTNTRADEDVTASLIACIQDLSDFGALDVFIKIFTFEDFFTISRMIQKELHTFSNTLLSHHILDKKNGE